MSFRVQFLIPAALALFAAPAFSQVAFVQGNVKDTDGKMVVGAVVAFDNPDMKSHMEVKTDKKGHYVASMRPANYNVTISVDGKVRGSLKGYLAVGGNGDPLDFDLGKSGPPAAATSAGAAPAGGGKPADDKAAKDREAQLAKNKALNEAFGQGKAAIENKQWDDAITALTKASEMDAKQQAVWAALEEAYVGSARTKKGDDQKAAYDKAFGAFDKLIELNPNEAGTYNNYALALAEDKKLDEAKVKLAKAVEIDPTGAGKYHYNMGALLMNAGAVDPAIDEFKKSTDADPNYAEAYFYLGSTLMGKATMDASGKMTAPAGTVEALQKYLQLKPDGPNADSAKQLIAALGSTVSTNYKDPNAPAPKTNTKKAATK